MEVRDLIKSLNDFYEVMRELSNDNIRLVIDKLNLDAIADYYLDVMKVDDDCGTLIKVLQYIYNNTDIEQPIPHDKYDRLYALYIENNNDIVGAPNSISDKDIRYHNYPDLRGTLDKYHYFRNSEKRDKDSRKSIEDWITTIVRACQAVNYTPTKEDLEVDIYPKWDGISGIFECDEDGLVEAALTRGDTESNEAVDLSKFFKKVKFKDFANEIGNRFGLKTELIMTKADFLKVLEIEEFSSPRSVISSIFSSDEPDLDLLKYLTIVPLRIQNFDTKEVTVVDFLDFHETCNLKDLDRLKEVSTNLYEKIKKDYPTDGVVYVLKSQRLREILGRKGAINKYEAAFKFPAESKITTLKDVIFSVGKLGGITPVAVFEPVVIRGNTITNASLGSIDRFSNLNLAIGDEVEIQYEIIPYLEPHKSMGGKIIEVPTHCPKCGNRLIKIPLLSCTNPECPAVKAGKILNFIGKMKIAFLSVGILAKLIEAGIVDSIIDLYHLESRRDEIVEIDGLGHKTLDKIIKSIETRSQDVPMHTLLGSLGIDSIGRKTFKKVCEKYSVNTFSDVCSYLTSTKYLLEVEGIQEITAKKMIYGLYANMELLSELLKFITIKKYDLKNNTSEAKLKVYFTNVRDKEFADFLNRGGIEVVDEFNKKIDMLIIPDVETKHSSKKDKALKWAKPVLTLSEAKAFFNYK